uniref:Actin n=1 Tax=Eutreptiella gymnastica TaxID=73025 RepID=A0A7S1N705_9EUGL|mmetsp:Transcript_131328/g.227314  ORF Transcript_131328/g.227314 Transcript_131328/m.227314 type:complete len:386 (+) Transcript_131328:158-1315(+)
MVNQTLGNVVVIDNGSHTVKAGYAGEHAPRALFSCLVGEPRNKGVVMATGDKEYYVGDLAQEKRGCLAMSNPIQAGEVVNWTDMERLWNHTFYSELKIEPEAHPCLVTEVPLNPLPHREKTAEIMFESFAVPGLYLAVTSVLALYSSGQTNGLVVDSGKDITMTVPIFEGYTLTRHIHKSKIAGQAITNYLNSLLMARGYNFTTANEMDIVNYMKESICYTALNYDEALEQSKADPSTAVKYPLPDGQDIVIAEERFKCTELMFDPSMYDVDKNALGLHSMCFESIGKCEAEMRKEQYRYIMLAGGSSLFEGLGKRIQTGIQSLYKQKFPNEPTVNAKVVVNVERMYATWLGGSMLGIFPMFHKMYISREEYTEHGPSIVHTKCF